MQIRIANRQDETAIRDFVSRQYARVGLELALDKDGGRDFDLRNVEAYYFGANGIFLVAEEDNEIIAVVGARALSDSVLGLRRLLVEPSAVSVQSESQSGAGLSGAGQTLALALLDKVMAFAPRMLFKSIEIGLIPEELVESGASPWKERSFKQCSNSGSWHKAIKPDF